MQPKPRDRFFARPAALLAFACLAACSGEAPAAPPAAASTPAYVPPAPVPTIFIVVDTLRADAILDPEGRYDTPAIDALGRDGVVFPRAFSAAPMTLPSHMSLFSSRPPFETRVLNNGQRVRPDLPLLAEWLAEKGYDTRAVISLGTLNPLEKSASPARGFASYDVDYRDIAMAEATRERLFESLASRDASKPLFLFAHFADPHEPYDSHGHEVRTVEVRMNGQPLDEIVSSDTNQWSRTLTLGPGQTTFEFLATGEEPVDFVMRRFECVEQGKDAALRWEVGRQMAKGKLARVVVDRGEKSAGECELRFWVNDVPENHRKLRERYRHEVAYVDARIGALVEELRRLDLYREALVVFTSDHGEGLGEHGFVGHVERLTDEMLHVPLIVKLPESDPRRAELERAAGSMVTHIDVVPTLLDVVGLPPLPGQRGQSLFQPHASVHIAETHRPEARRTQVALRDEQFKMVYFPGDPDAEPPQPERFEMYDLASDPDERVDVFAKRSGERKDWPQQLVTLHAQSANAADAGAADETEEQRREREEMLNALGYGGGAEE